MEEGIGFFVWWCETLGHRSAIVFGHAIFPLEKVGYRLRFDANFYPPQACQQQVHFVTKASRRAKIRGRFVNDSDFPSSQLEQSPACRQLVGTDDPCRSQVKALASHADVGLYAKWFFSVCEKVAAGNFALQHHRMAAALPADGIWSFAAGATLLGKNDAATISGAKPMLGHADKLLMGHV